MKHEMLRQGTAVFVMAVLLTAGQAVAGKATGLRVHPTNPRYFTDGSGKAIYLTGAHTWNNLVDMGPDDPPRPFDFDAYLDFLEQHGHNFIRLWTWDSTAWDTRANRELGKGVVCRVAPLPWARTGPGKALDGKPKFDLTKFDPDYFERLRARVAAAQRRGMYVSVMLFEGWGLRHGNLGRRDAPDGWAWRAHPFHPDNNANGINAEVVGDGSSAAVHSLANPKVSALQAAYLRKVVDTVNDLDNVLYEVINEGGEKDWDWWVAKTVRDYERTKPQQHPVGITGHGAERLESMLASPAEWISPGSQDGFRDDPPAWDGQKVSLLDTDHIWGIGGSSAWAWKSFVRGHNPIFMDPHSFLDPADTRVLGKGTPEQWTGLRRSLGHTRRLAERVDLAAMTPHDELSSTKYCLAAPGVAYVVYLPAGGEATVDLAGASGSIQVEWIHPVEGTTHQAGEVTGGGSHTFQAQSPGAVVLFLSRQRPESRRGSDSRPLRIQDASAAIVEATVTGPAFHAPELFQGFEDYYNPRLKRLREEYQLDKVVEGETNEFRRILKLRHWVHKPLAH